jgi:hypothetical protein
MRNTSTGFTCPQVIEAPYLDETGAISVDLFANDDTGTVPTGRQYFVTVDIIGAPSYSGYIVVPHAAPGATATLESLWVTAP